MRTHKRSEADKQIFEALVRRVEEVAREKQLPKFKAFPRWFIPIYYDVSPNKISITDADGDGKADASFEILEDGQVIRVLINSKYTGAYNRLAPPAFYDELQKYKLAFEKRNARSEFLEQTVRRELQAKFNKFFDEYDAGRLRLFFITNCRRNPRQTWAVDGIELYHFEDIASFVIDDLENLIPRTRPLTMRAISQVLSPGPKETEVPTTVVFAKIVDFIDYMRADPLDLLFARNVRLDLGKTPVNESIVKTFKKKPHEFVYSNNGVTIICDKIEHDPGTSKLTLFNPRIVNGSQTLHSVRTVTEPSGTARIMTRIIQIPSPEQGTVSALLSNRKDIIEKISFRSNQQNPIKLWDLCSNDDNQVAIQGYFRKKGYYYETRTREWITRKDYLSAEGVAKALGIKYMGQLFAAYHWKDKEPLGPASAKNRPSLIFDRGTDGGYAYVKKLKPLLAYNLYLLERSIKNIKFPQSAPFLGMKRHANFCIYGLVCKSFERIGIDLETEELEVFVKRLSESKRFRSAILSLARIAYDAFTSERKHHKEAAGEELTYNNYFKSEAYLKPLLHSSIPNNVLDAIKASRPQRSLQHLH